MLKNTKVINASMSSIVLGWPPTQSTMMFNCRLDLHSNISNSNHTLEGYSYRGGKPSCDGLKFDVSCIHEMSYNINKAEVLHQLNRRISMDFAI